MTKTVLITGASGGIGSAAALRFGQAGYAVAIHYHNSRDAAFSLRQQLEDMGCDADCFGADISDRNQVERMVEDATRRFAHIDVLINNAGMAQQKLFCDITATDWERMIGVNLTGVFHTCQCVLPQMLRRQKGKIINVSSIWGITGASCEVHYSAVKAAVIGLTKALAREVGPSGIQVNCIAPGVVDTPMNAALDAQIRAQLCDETPLGTIGTPQDIAHALLFFASEQADFITGQVLSPNGGFVI